MKIRDRERLTAMLTERLPHYDVSLDSREISVSTTTNHENGSSTHSVIVNLSTIRADYKGPGWRDRLVADVAKAIEGDR